MSDIVVRHRLFWSLSILGTEKWLDEMASSGLVLCGLNFHGRFKFKRMKPQNCRFCFSYNKYINSSHEKLSKDWEKVARRKRWTVYKTENCSPKILPNKRGLYLHNNSLLCLYAFLSSLILLLILAFTFSFYSMHHNFASYGSFIRTTVTLIGVFAIVILGNFVLYLTLTSANSHILENGYDTKLPIKEYHRFISSKTFEDWLEKLLIKDGDIFKRIHVIWFFTPKEIEKWLAKMQAKGYSVYKIHKSGTMFYFTKGVPKKTAYAVITGESANIASCIENGWQVVFSGAGLFGKSRNIAVVSCPYKDKRPLPFSNEKQTTMNAARILEKYTILYSVCLMIFIALISIFVYLRAQMPLLTIAAAAIVICVILLIRMIVYFARTVLKAKKAFN